MAELKCKKCGAILNDDNCDELIMRAQFFLTAT